MVMPNDKEPTKTKKSSKKKMIKVSTVKQIKALTLFDNVFMGAAFDEQIPMTELLLREIMKKPDLTVISTRCERSFTNIGARSIRLDVFAKDSKDRYYNIEVQRDEAGADLRRMRFHAALITSKLLAAGEDFKDVPEVVVIFICETDIFKKGLPLYEITRYNHQTGETFDDGERIIVVNGEIQDDTPLGTIMHDFHCKDAADVKNAVLRERIEYMKDTEEGQMEMSGIIEQYAEKRAKRYMKKENKERIRRLIRRGKDTVEEIAEIFPEFTLDEIRRIEAKEMSLV